IGRSTLDVGRWTFAARQYERHQFLFANPLSPMRDVTLVSNDAVLNFKFCRRRAHIDHLVRYLHELIEIERAIIECARMTKPILYEQGFARTVAFVPPSALRNL